MENKAKRVIKELEDSIDDLYPGEVIEKASRAAIELIKELEDIRQLQISSIKAYHEAIHKIRYVVDEL